MSKTVSLMDTLTKDILIHLHIIIVLLHIITFIIIFIITHWRIQSGSGTS